MIGDIHEEVDALAENERRSRERGEPLRTAFVSNVQSSTNSNVVCTAPNSSRETNLKKFHKVFIVLE